MGEIYFCKLKHNGKVAHFTSSSEIDAVESVKLLDNAKFKKMTINAEIVIQEEVVVKFKVNFLKIIQKYFRCLKYFGFGLRDAAFPVFWEKP